MADRRNEVAAALTAYEPSLRERIGNATYDVAKYLGLPYANRMRGNIEGAVDFIPGVGDAVGFDDAAADYRAGNYGRAALNAGASAIGAVPVGGDLAAGAMKAIFAGVGAATANKPMLMKAKELAEAGIDRADILRDTGWFKGVDDAWRFEIDDSKAFYDPEALTDLRSAVADDGRVFDPLKDTTTVGGTLGHAGLYQAYPEAADIPLHFLPQERMRGALGAYSPAYDRMTLADNISVGDGRSFGLHEVQHAIQNREGFSSGGNAPYEELYRLLAGEVEARNVQARMNMTPAQRVFTPPWLTQDVIDSLQIIKK